MEIKKELPLPFLFGLDVETGGFEPGRHALLSVGCWWNSETEKRRTFHVRVQRQDGLVVEPAATAVNGWKSDKQWADAGAVSDNPPAVLDQILQGSGLLRIRQPGLETITVVNEQLDGILGVSRVVFSTRRRECLAVVSQGRRVDGIEDEEVVIDEGKDERAATLLKADSHFSSAEAKAHGSGPLLEGLWGVIDDRELFLTRSSIDQAEVVFLVGPIEADESSKFRHKVLRNRSM